MQMQSFRGVVLAGHKEHAVEVPFDPVAMWGRSPVRFAPGRTGVPVSGKIHDIAFTSHVVRRSGKHWLLLPAEVERAAGLLVGGEATVTLCAVDGGA